MAGQLKEEKKMNKCTYCGREDDAHELKPCGGYWILTCCTDCEEEIIEDQSSHDEEIPKYIKAIHEHFESVSDEKFEQNLKDAGYGEIKPSPGLVNPK